jgi:hypothetical protein
VIWAKADLRVVRTLKISSFLAVKRRYRSADIEDQLKMRSPS